MYWSCDDLNLTVTTANPGNKSPHELWHGAAAPPSPHPFFHPGYCRWNRPSTSSPRAESCFYSGPGIDHTSDVFLVLTRANTVVKSRDVTWGATLNMEAPSPQLPVIPEQGQTQGIENAPELEGTEDFVSDPTTPLPELERGISHKLRVVPPMTQTSGGFCAEDVEPNHTSTASSESSNSDSSSQAGSDVSTSNSGALSDTSNSGGEALGDVSSPESRAQTPTVVRTAERQRGAHMSGPGDDDGIRKVGTTAQTRALNQEAVAGLVSGIGPCKGGRVFQALLAETKTGREKMKFMDCLAKETEPLRSSKHSGVWMTRRHPSLMVSKLLKHL